MTLSATNRRNARRFSARAGCSAVERRWAGRRMLGRRSVERRMDRWFGCIEVLEPRMTLSATSIAGRPYLDVGPSDNVAWDQPRVTVQLLTQDVPNGTEPPSNVIVGPTTFNNWLLDTGANTTLAFQTAVTDMKEFEPRYQTDGKYDEIGVGGTSSFDISIPYRFDFSGNTTYERQKLLNKRIISNPNTDVSIFGPWGIVGMPAMTGRVTTLDFTPWTTVTDFDLFMKTDFSNSLPAANGPRFTINVDNRVSFDAEDGFVSGNGLPMWADLPFFGAQLKNNESLTSGNFLFDTGAQVSILSSKLAFQLGLDTNHDGKLDALDANFARSETIGGISGSTSAPVFLIDEVHIPSAQGPDLVWTDLQWIVLDIADGIDGVFGFDNMTSGWIEAFSIDGQSGFIMKSYLDFRSWDATGRGQIHIDLNPEYATLVDPNGPGALVTETGGMTVVSESGISDTYDIRLTQAPTANVTVSFVGSGGQATAFDALNPSRNFVTFTPANWMVPQTVRVLATNDSTEESYHRSFIRNISTSADPAYNAVGMPRVAVGIVDDDFPGVMLLPSGGQTLVTEAGDTDFYDIVLATKPTQNVSIQLEHVAKQLTAVSDATGTDTLVFTSSNWNIPQRVRVAAVDDSLSEGPHVGYITHKITTSDLGYQQAFVLQEKVFIEDNDIADSKAPTVSDVIVGSRAWTSQFIDAVDGGGAGAGNGLGMSMVGTQQLDNLPWTNVDKLYIRFSEDVSAGFKSANLRLAGTNMANYLSGAQLSYGLDGPNVGTISLAAPISSDSLILTILDSLTDAVGNRLDGEWAAGGGQPSGNGAGGGNFNFQIDVLPGDANNSSGVNLSDIFAIYASNLSVVTNMALAKLDVNGSGGINLSDLFDAYKFNLSVLPSAPAIPTLSSSVESVASATSPIAYSTWSSPQLVDRKFGVSAATIVADQSTNQLAAIRIIPGGYAAMNAMAIYASAGTPASGIEPSSDSNVPPSDVLAFSQLAPPVQLDAPSILAGTDSSDLPSDQRLRQAAVDSAVESLFLNHQPVPSAATADHTGSIYPSSDGAPEVNDGSGSTATDDSDVRRAMGAGQKVLSRRAGATFVRLLS